MMLFVVFPTVVIAAFVGCHFYHILWAKYYRHYKGGLYKIVEGFASLESEGPLSEYVVYKSTDAGQKVWIRKRAEFFSKVEDQYGNKTFRFEKITYLQFCGEALKKFFAKDNEGSD